VQQKPGAALHHHSNASIRSLPVYHCYRIHRNLSLTGKVSDRAWRYAQVIHLNNPIDGKPGRYPTTARVLYNKHYLYIAFQCEDRFVWGTLTEHDAQIFTEECVEAFICPSGKMRQYYEIDVSPRNTVFDAFILNGRPLNGKWRDLLTWKDYTCDGLVTRVWIDGELGKQGAKGWSAEYAIPFSSIIGSDHLTPRRGDEWRLNLYRIDSPQPPHLEFYAWSPTGANDFHRPWRFGFLKFE